MMQINRLGPLFKSVCKIRKCLKNSVMKFLNELSDMEPVSVKSLA